MVVHVYSGPNDGGAAGSDASDLVEDGVTRVGFVVSRGVGSAVIRNRVRRRLRHLVRPYVAGFTPGSLVVVRANAAAAGSSWSELAADLEKAVQRVASPVRGRR